MKRALVRRRRSLCAVILMAFLVFTGFHGKTQASGQSAFESGDMENGVMLRRAEFCDAESGLPAFRSVIPQGWSAAATLHQVYDLSYPLRAIATAASPDGRSQFAAYSPMTLVQIMDSNYIEYVSGIASTEEYKTYLDYMDAAQWCDFVVDSDFSGGTRISTRSLTKEQAQPVFDYVKTVADGFQSPDPTGTVETDEVTDYGVSIACQTYQVGDGRCVSVFGVICWYDFHTELVAAQLLPFGFYSDTRLWQPVAFLSVAPDFQAMQAQDALFDIFIANASYTPELEYTNLRVQSRILDAIAQRDAEKLRITGEIIRGSYSGYAGGSDTNDRVTEMWDDVILEQENYNGSDGSSIKIPTSYSHVFENGAGGYFATNSALNHPGTGWNQMTPGYK